MIVTYLCLVPPISLLHDDVETVFCTINQSIAWCPYQWSFLPISLFHDGLLLEFFSTNLFIPWWCPTNVLPYQSLHCMMMVHYLSNVWKNIIVFINSCFLSIHYLGSGSDFAPFIYRIGVPAFTMSYYFDSVSNNGKNARQPRQQFQRPIQVSYFS